MTTQLDVVTSAEHLLALYIEVDRALAVAAAETVQQTVTVIARLSVLAIPGVEQASITESRHSRFRTLVSTGPMASEADGIQYELGSGPCVDAVTDDAVCRSDDVSVDGRWPSFGRRAAAETGAASVMAFRLYLENDRDLITGLNLYSTRLAAFDEFAQTVASVVATHSAQAMMTATARATAAHLNQALASNREIGTAMGIIMATHKVTRGDAFDMLRTASQNSNRKLIDIAIDVVDTGLLEPTPANRHCTRRR